MRDADLDAMKSIALNKMRELWPDLRPYTDYVQNLRHVSYPQMFGSTAGPFQDGLAGKGFTEFRIDAFTMSGPRAVLFANGRFWKTTENFTFTVGGT